MLTQEPRERTIRRLVALRSIMNFQDWAAHTLLLSGYWPISLLRVRERERANSLRARREQLKFSHMYPAASTGGGSQPGTASTSAPASDSVSALAPILEDQPQLQPPLPPPFVRVFMQNQGPASSTATSGSFSSNGSTNHSEAFVQWVMDGMAEPEEEEDIVELDGETQSLTLASQAPAPARGTKRSASQMSKRVRKVSWHEEE